MRVLIFSVAVWMCAALCSAAGPFDGKWVAEAGTEKLTITLVAGDGKVTGNIVTEGTGEAPIEWGFVKGDILTFKVKRVFQGAPAWFVYLGKIEGDQIAFGRRPEDLSLGALREFNATRVK